MVVATRYNLGRPTTNSTTTASAIIRAVRRQPILGFTRLPQQYLFKKADGVFLIRPSTTSSPPFAFSTAYRGVVKGIGHIQILRSDRGYGFTEPYLLFPSLVDLVFYCASHSLEEHNPDLTTTLAYPLFGLQPKSTAKFFKEYSVTSQPSRPILETF